MYVECGMKLVYFQLMSWPAAGDTHVDRSKGGVTLNLGDTEQGWGDTDQWWGDTDQGWGDTDQR